MRIKDGKAIGPASKPNCGKEKNREIVEKTRNKKSGRH